MLLHPAKNIFACFENGRQLLQVIAIIQMLKQKHIYQENGHQLNCNVKEQTC